MKILFTPRDIGMWRDVFEFNNTTCAANVVRDKIFYTQEEFFEFLKLHGVKFDDPEHPLEMIDFCIHPTLGAGTKIVRQWTVIGWVNDKY